MIGWPPVLFTNTRFGKQFKKRPKQRQDLAPTASSSTCTSYCEVSTNAKRLRKASARRPSQVLASAVWTAYLDLNERLIGVVKEAVARNFDLRGAFSLIWLSELRHHQRDAPARTRRRSR